MKYMNSVVFTFFFFIYDDIHKSSKKCRPYTHNLRRRYYYDHVAGLSEFYWSAYEFLKVSLITQYIDASMSYEITHMKQQNKQYRTEGHMLDKV